MDTLKKIGKYKYNERHCLGEGSFGKVYEGCDETGRRVAIKKLQQRMIATDPYLKQSLSTQIAIMKRLKHRNIVQLIDTVTTQNSIYLVLQFCSGGDLKRYSMNKKFSQQEALKIMKQLIEGFYQIVNEGIIHRDLKPANVLVHEGIFKICDFGFAKYFGQMNKMARTCVGTPIYMSPQVLKQKPYTSKTDIWSLGVMFYQMLFGKLPFIGKSQDEIFKLITRGTLSFPKCTQESYLFLKNTLVIDQQQRWDWKKVFDHFDIKKVNQKPGFYHHIINNFFKSGTEENLKQKQKIYNHSISNQNKQKRNNSFKDKINFKYISSPDSPQKQQQLPPKNKHNRLAKNIFAQDDSPLLPPQLQLKNKISEQQQINLIQPKQYFQKVYTEKQMQRIRWLYSQATNFLYKQNTCNYIRKVSSFQIFLYRLVTFTINEYNKMMNPSNMKQTNQIKRIILESQISTLKRLLPQIKNYGPPCTQISSIASVIIAEGNYIFYGEELKILQELKNFNLLSS